MEKSFEAKLWINGVAVDLNPFVEEFVSRTLSGAVHSLKGIEDIRALEFGLEDGYVKLVVNGNEVRVTPFPNDIMANMVTGIVSTLKDVGEVETLRINVTAL